MNTELSNMIFEACDNAVYIKKEFNHVPYISKLIEKYGAKCSDSISSFIELFWLIGKAVKTNLNLVEAIDFSENEYSQGVYLIKNGDLVNGFEKYTGVAVIEIPKGKFKSFVLDSGGGITNSIHTTELFKDVSGQYLIPFVFDGIYVHPNCFTYFFIEKDTDRLMPLEAIDFNLFFNDENNGLNWIDEAIDFANKNLGFHMETQPNSDFIQVVKDV